jgi:hypothetical protein
MFVRAEITSSLAFSMTRSCISDTRWIVAKLRWLFHDLKMISIL